MNTLQTMIRALGKPRLLVLGDLMLDSYRWGDVCRISPEAPVPILRSMHTQRRLGGAASVAMLLRALDAEVSLAGVVGEDASGTALRRLLDAHGIDAALVLPDSRRPTTTKERLLARSAHRDGQPVLRIDRESTRPLRQVLQRRLATAACEAIPEHAAVLISDYAKGVCTPELLAQLIERARACGVPVLIDPARITDYQRYRGATLLTPNRIETEMATGRPIRTVDHALAAGAELRDRLAVDAVLVKLDRSGMVLVADEHDVIPAHPRRVRDVTGAGDTVLALAGVCSACGWDWSDAAALANVAAALQVERPGVAPVTWAEIHAALVDNAAARCGKLLTLDEMALLAEAYRADGRRIVLTNGCFDLLHPGHVACLTEAATLGDVLVVAINADVSVHRLKGPGRPVLSETDRAAMLAALACVDHVVIFDDDTPHAMLRRLRPDVLVKGGTYTTDEVVGHEVVEAYGGRVCVTRRVAGISSTGILATLGDLIPRAVARG